MAGVQRNDLTGNIRATLRLGSPIIAANLAQNLIQVTDVVMLGWYSVEALAAAVLGTSAYFVIYVVGSGFANAVMPLVAASSAEGNEAMVRRTVRMGIWASALYAALVLPALLSAEPIFLLLGQEPKLASEAAKYLRIAGFAMGPALVIWVMRSFFAALERPQVALWATVLSAIVNALFNYAFIFGNWGAPELGLLGAAWASLLTTLIAMAVICGWAAIDPTTRRMQLFRRIWRVDTPVLRRVYGLGWPIGASLLAESSLFASTAVMMGWLGTVPLAAHGIALQLASLAFMAHLGISSAGTVRVGRAVGRHDVPGVRQAAVAAVLTTLIWAMLASALFLIWPEQLMALFLDRGDPAYDQIIAYGVLLLALAAAFQVVDGGQVVVLGALRGLPDTRVPMFMTVISYWGIGIPASLLLGFSFGLGGAGVWSGLVAGLAAAFAMLLVRFLQLTRPD